MYLEGGMAGEKYARGGCHFSVVSHEGRQVYIVIGEGGVGVGRRGGGDKTFWPVPFLKYMPTWPEHIYMAQICVDPSMATSTPRFVNYVITVCTL